MANSLHINHEAEEWVLAALMLDPDRIPEAAAWIAGDDFSDARNRRVFEAMLGLSGRGEPCDLVTLGYELAQRGTLEFVGGRTRLGDLIQSVTSSAHLLHYTRIVADAARLRRVTTVARAIADEAEGVRPMGESVAVFLEEAEQRLLRASAARSLGALDLVERDVGHLQSLIEAGPVEGMAGLRTGIRGLDEILCGLRPGDLGVIGARPSIGKSAIAGNIAMSVALRERPLAVALFSLEMNRQSVLERFAAALAGVNHYWIRNRRLSAEHKQRVESAMADLGRAPLAIDDTSDQTIMSIRAKARRFKQRHGLALVVVDYLQLVRSPRSENRLQEVSAVSRSLKALAGELNVPVLACAQLNRAADVGADERPRLSHLRESGSIEADADIVILLQQVADAHEPDEPRKVDATVAKNRNGPVGTAHLLFQAATLRFVDLAESNSDAAPRVQPTAIVKDDPSVHGTLARPLFDDVRGSVHDA